MIDRGDGLAADPEANNEWGLDTEGSKQTVAGSSSIAANQSADIPPLTLPVVKAPAVPVDEKSTTAAPAAGTAPTLNSEKSATAEPALANAPTLNGWLEKVAANSADPEKPDLLFVEAFRALKSRIREGLSILAEEEPLVVYDPSISQPSSAPYGPLGSERWINRKFSDAYLEIDGGVSLIKQAIANVIASTETNTSAVTDRNEQSPFSTESLHPIHMRQVRPVLQKLLRNLDLLESAAFDTLSDTQVAAIVKATADALAAIDTADSSQNQDSRNTAGVAKGTWEPKNGNLSETLGSIRELDSLLRSKAAPLGELYVEIPKDISPASRSIVLSLFDHPTKRVNDGVSAIITVTLGYQSKDPQLVDGTFVDPEAGWHITSFLGPKGMSDLLIEGGIPLHTPFRAPEGAARDAWFSRQVGDAAGSLMRDLQQVSGRSKSPITPQEKYLQLMRGIHVVLQTQLGIDSPSSGNPLAGIIAALSAGFAHGSPAAKLQYERTVGAFNMQLAEALGIPYQQRVTISAAPQQLSNWRQLAEQSRATDPSSIESVRLAAIEWLERYCRKQLEIPAGKDVVLGSTESGTSHPAGAGDDGRFGLPHSVRLEDLYPEFSPSDRSLQTIKLHARPEAVGVESSTPVVMIAIEQSPENSWRICVLATGASQTQTQQHQALAFTGFTDENAADYTLVTN